MIGIDEHMLVSRIRNSDVFIFAWCQASRRAFVAGLESVVLKKEQS